KGFAGIYRLYTDLKKLNIDYVADLHNVLRSKILRTFFKLSGKKVAFTDKGRKERKDLTKATNKVLKPIKPMVERHVDTFKAFGFTIDLKKISFNNPLKLSNEILSITGDKSKDVKWVGIAPFAQYQTK